MKGVNNQGIKHYYDSNYFDPYTGGSFSLNHLVYMYVHFEKACMIFKRKYLKGHYLLAE